MASPCRTRLPNYVFDRYAAGVALRPEDVFTPASPVQEDMFAARRHADLESRVQLALTQRGRQVVLYGDTGVGKTSLVYHLAHVLNVPMVRLECGPSFDDLLKDALSEVADHQETGWIDRTAMTGRAKGSVGVLSGETAGTTERTTHNAPTERTLQAAVIDALEAAGIRLLFLDNFENTFGAAHANETTRRVTQLLKSLADRADDGQAHLRLVVAGIPSASEALIDLEEAAARRTAQIEVTRMPMNELDQILARGEEKLKMDFAGTCRHMILMYSDGFPYYTHLLALHCARRAFADGRHTVDLADFDGALDEILVDCDLQLRQQFSRAIETSGTVRTRRSIMEAMASLNDQEVSFAAIRAAFLRAHPEYRDASRLNFLSTAITPLRDEYRIVADLGKRKSTKNLYRFRNPLMRGYVRLRMRRDNAGQGRIWDPLDGAPPEVTVTSA